MSKEDRTPTDIMVKVIDFSEDCRRFEKEYKEKHDLDAEMRVEKAGVIEVGDDRYLLINEGILFNTPLNKSEGETLTLFIEIPINEKQKSIRTEYVRVTNEDAENISHEENLIDFVRSFGWRLDANYAKIVKFIKGEQAKVTA